jgi:hypothetical protein
MRKIIPRRLLDRTRARLHDTTVHQHYLYAQNIIFGRAIFDGANAAALFANIPPMDAFAPGSGAKTIHDEQDGC